MPATQELETGLRSAPSKGYSLSFHGLGSGPGLLSEALHYFCCRDICERVALGRRPMSENASKVLQQKSGGQETLPRRFSDNKILFGWCCPPRPGNLVGSTSYFLVISLCKNQAACWDSDNIKLAKDMQVSLGSQSRALARKSAAG